MSALEHTLNMVRTRRVWCCQGAACVGFLACSMLMKGPISPPVGVMTPTTPATARTQNVCDDANVNAATAASAAPICNVLRLPRRSARVERKKEKTRSI